MNKDQKEIVDVVLRELRRVHDEHHDKIENSKSAGGAVKSTIDMSTGITGVFVNAFAAVLANGDKKQGLAIKAAITDELLTMLAEHGEEV